ALAHDPAVGANVRGARSVLDQSREVRQPAGGLELAGPLQVLANRDRVWRLIALDELRDRAEDQPVIGAVEVVDAYDVRDLVPRALIEHEAAEQGLLGLDGMRRQPDLVRGRERRSGRWSGFGHYHLLGRA